MFFSSHQIAEVDQIADHVAIIDRGRRGGAGALDDLREQLSAASSWCSTATRRSRRSARRASCAMRREGPRADACCRAPGRGRILDEARALNPVSVDVVPVTLKEIFLETVTAED